MSGTGDDYGLGIAVGSDGSVYTTGFFRWDGGLRSGPRHVTTSPAVAPAPRVCFLSKLNGNQLPTITNITDRMIDENEATGAIAFTVGDVETAAGSLTVSGSSSNTTLVPNGNIVFGGSGANRTVTVTPAANQFGTATITVTVKDADGGTTSDNFVLTVSPLVSISGHVWKDLNSNGIQDTDEPRVPNAVVELMSSTDSAIGNADDVSRGIAITDANGAYSFSNLPNGLNYYENFRTPVGYTFTTKDASSNTLDTVDSDANATGVSDLFTVATGGSDTPRDAGLLGAAPSFRFALSAGGTVEDHGESVATDSAGNAYVTGYFRGTADFDPGPGVSNLTSAGDDDIFVAKYSSDGALAWAKAMGGTDYDRGAGIAVGLDGSVYTTGYFNGTVDFDPGKRHVQPHQCRRFRHFSFPSWILQATTSGPRLSVARAMTLPPASPWGQTGASAPPAISRARRTSIREPARRIFPLGGGTFFVSKLDSSGNYVWAKAMGGTGTEYGTSIAVGPDGSVYTTGNFYGTADFDPGTGTANLTSAGQYDIFVSKLDIAGNYVWAKAMGATMDDDGRGIAVGPDGSVCITGDFEGTVDFDPGSGTTNLTSAAFYDIFVLKLDIAGNYVWAKAMGGTNCGLWLRHRRGARRGASTRRAISSIGLTSIREAARRILPPRVWTFSSPSWILRATMSGPRPWDARTTILARISPWGSTDASTRRAISPARRTSIRETARTISPVPAARTCSYRNSTHSNRRA